MRDGVVALSPVTQLNVNVRGTHELHPVEYDHGVWQCDCEYFITHRQCSHTIAVEKVRLRMIRWKSATFTFTVTPTFGFIQPTGTLTIRDNGVPIGVKDIIDTFDMPTEMGSPIYRGYRSGAFNGGGYTSSAGIKQRSAAARFSASRVVAVTANTVVSPELGGPMPHIL